MLFKGVCKIRFSGSTRKKIGLISLRCADIAGCEGGLAGHIEVGKV